MLEFIKMFGLGILYTILFPFIVVIFVAFLVYVFCDYLFLEVKTLVGFFFGYTFTTDTELEVKLKEMKENAKLAAEKESLKDEDKQLPQVAEESEGDKQWVTLTF